MPLEDAEVSGAESSLGAVADAEFREDVGDVVFDGAFGEVHAFGNLRVGETMAEVGKDIKLTFG